MPLPTRLCAQCLLFIATACLLPTWSFAASFTSVKSGAWSDPSTWGLGSEGALNPRNETQPGLPLLVGLLPGPGDDVFVASGTIVTYDSPEPTRVDVISIQLGAVLTCPRNVDIARSLTQGSGGRFHLTVKTLRVENGGCFSCGYGDCSSDAEPFAGEFTLRLSSDRPPVDADDNSRTLSIESGGALFLSGASRVRPVTRLAADLRAGDAALRVSDSDIFIPFSQAGADASLKPTQGWRAGDRLAIAPTGKHPTQTEYGTVVDIDRATPSEADGAGSAVTITLADPLQYARTGRAISLVNRADGNRKFTVDARAEIALLSRNLVIEGTNDALSGLGGDVMMAGSGVRARLSWVELRYLGRRGHLGRYPLHIHNLGDSGRNVQVSNVAVHSSFQRGIVVHCTDGVTLTNNTVAGSFGFAYMLEDGAEENNTLINNYAIDVRPSAYPLIQTERINSAGFWFVNAANSFVGNVAAGVSGPGFSLDMDPVLATRPATLSTCPERLPGYDARLAAAPDGAAEFSNAINTALIRKNFRRFDDNLVHSSHSGLWLTYPFTPMFFVNRTVPLAGFTAWNIAARQMPSSDGVALGFDGCVRLKGQRGMHILDLTCINADLATWASCANTFVGTTVAWVDSHDDSSVPSPSLLGSLFTHAEPQVFLRTQITGRPRAPLLLSIAAGGPLSTLNTLGGIAIDDDAGPPSVSYSSAGQAQQPQPMIQLRAGDVQVFTDETGDAFGAGPGATVSATFANASGLDPVVEVYAAGQCTTGTYAASRARWHVSSSALPNGRIVAVNGGLPVLCLGSTGLRFSALSASLRVNGAPGKLPAIDIGKPLPGRDDGVMLRRAASLPVLLPINDASKHPVTGGYWLRFEPGGWQATSEVAQLEIGLSTTMDGSDGITLRLTGLPAGSRAAQNQTSAKNVALFDAASTTCPQLIEDCSQQKVKPDVCVCYARDKLGEMFVRFLASRWPRYIGFQTYTGDPLPVYNYASLQVDLGA